MSDGCSLWYQWKVCCAKDSRMRNIYFVLSAIYYYNAAFFTEMKCSLVDTA